MTLVTQRVIIIDLPDGEIAYCDLTWDSPGPDPDPEGGTWLYEGPLVSVYAKNNSSIYTVTGEFKRTTGQAVFSGALGPGQDVTYTGGGPVKNVDDIGGYSIFWKAE
jgi:hypothetical protein